MGDLPDLEKILALWIKDRDTGKALPDEVRGVLEAVEASVNGTNSRTYMIATTNKGQVLGMMGMVEPDAEMRVHARTARPVELINAYVDPQQRGTGAGKLLAQQLEALAIARSYTELVVNSGPRYSDTGWPFWIRRFGQPLTIMKDFYGPGGDTPFWSKILSTEDNL